MTIVTKPLQKPNLCIICNHSNDVEYWDTERYLDTPFVFDKAGRKYVCAECITSAAKEFGFLPSNEAEEIKQENLDLRIEIKEIKLQSDLSKTIQEAARTLAAGHPGVAASLEPIFQESVPDVAKVEDSEIVETVDTKKKPKTK